MGRSTKFGKYSTAQLDIRYGALERSFNENPFDMTLPSGMALLGYMCFNFVSIKLLNTNMTALFSLNQIRITPKVGHLGHLTC